MVISSAIKKGNPELDEARRRNLPVVRRAEMLAELMRLKSNVAVAGTHGKTTTTTMVATLLDKGGIDPTVINGGIIHAYGSNARVGAGEWMVVEADESDGSFNRLPATIAIVTNIDPEHMDHWGTFEALRKRRSTISSRTSRSTASRSAAPTTPRCRRWSAASPTAASSPSASTRRPTCGRVNLTLRERRRAFRRAAAGRGRGRGDRGLHPADAGRSQRLERAGRRRRGPPSGHEDATRSARRWPASPASTAASPRSARWNGVTIIDDYGHHPVEIAAVLKAARQATQGPGHRRPPAAPLHPAVATSSRSSAPASTRPTWWRSPRSMPPARTRSRASAATIWSPA